MIQGVLCHGFEEVNKLLQLLRPLRRDAFADHVDELVLVLRRDAGQALLAILRQAEQVIQLFISGFSILCRKSSRLRIMSSGIGGRTERVLAVGRFAGAVLVAQLRGQLHQDFPVGLGQFSRHDRCQDWRAGLFSCFGSYSCFDKQGAHFCPLKNQ